MSYHTDITTAILASTALSAVIGDRFFWDVADGSAVAPFLIAQTISGNSDTTHDGDRSLLFDLIQITAWAKPKLAALSLAAVMKTELEGVTLPGTSGASLTYAGGQSTYDPETKLSGEIIEYRVSALTI